MPTVRASTQIIAMGRNLLMHSRCQQAIGQGGFHTAELVSTEYPGVVVRSPTGVRLDGNASFRYVYDCGTRQLGRRRSVIQRFARSVPERLIELLFLSHFDDDHVNGIPDLLDSLSGLKADTIVMPWVDDVERLIAFGRAVSRGGAIGSFFQGLTVDPVSALDVFGPRRILLVRSGPGEPDDRETIDLRPDGRGLDGPFRAKVVVDGGLRRMMPAQPSRTAGISANVHEIYDDMIIDVSSFSGAASWIFKPYVRSCNAARVANFERAAERLLAWPWGSFRSTIADPNVRHQLVTNRVSSKALAASYRSAFGDRNLTSLCVFSGPRWTESPKKLFSFDLQKFDRASKIGWLATGDIPLKDPKEATELLAHYKEQTEGVATLGLPHHGSVNNYSSAVVTAFRPQACFVSAKPPKNWKHPHPSVMADVASQGAIGVHVDDTEASAFSEAFLLVI